MSEGWADVSERRWRVIGPWLAAGALLLAVTLLLGCASGSGSATATATATTSGSVNTPTGPLINGSPTATASSQGTPGIPLGVSSLCSQPSSITAQLPSSIPAFPNAKLRVGQSEGGSGFYGFCTTDSVSAVATFYANKLPASGWQNVTTNTIDTTTQLQAAHGSARITITVFPDSQAGQTDIVINTSGV